MDLKNHFIQATRQYNDIFGTWVPAPCIRRQFSAANGGRAVITVACVGFYRLFCNGAELTKGFLAPYISNADHYIYYDTYEVQLRQGENVIGLLLGNGLSNNPGGYIWDFDKCPYRTAPMVSLSVTDPASGALLLVSDKAFRTAPSPILCDDYRFGEHYDANREIIGWQTPGFDDSLWNSALPVTPPKGELRQGIQHPIVTETELSPVKIWPDGTGSYIYDFGQSNAGLCRLTIDGRKGQKVELQYSDAVYDGRLVLENMWFVREYRERDRELVHKDSYVCKGEKGETYLPSLTYHGFRFRDGTSSQSAMTGSYSVFRKNK